MERTVVLFIHTPWRQAHKWPVDHDGLVDFDGHQLSPKDAVDRFLVDYPMFTVLRADVCERIDNPDGARPYRWIQIERFI